MRISAKEGFLLGNNRFFGIINTYNRREDGDHIVNAKNLFTERNELTLVVSDLNLHTA